MKPSLHLIPPTFETLPHGRDETDEDVLFSLKISPKETLLVGNSGALAPLYILEESRKDPSQTWACAELVHIHATRDHLVLTPPQELEISPEEEQSLRLAVQEAIHDLAPDGLIPFPNRWVFQANHFKSLKTSSPALAFGRNIDAWTPKDTDIPGLARKWRQIQNEIQMIWHDHPVNLERESKGQLPINSIWLYGIGALEEVKPHPALASCSDIVSSQKLYEGLSTFLEKSLSTSNEAELSLNRQTWMDWSESSEHEWETIWSQALKALHDDNISVIELFQENQFGKEQLEFKRLESKDFSAPLLTKIFNSKKAKASQYPSWPEFIRKLNSQT
jgi:hypothetical protein